MICTTNSKPKQNWNKGTFTIFISDILLIEIEELFGGLQGGWIEGLLEEGIYQVKTLIKT